MKKRVITILLAAASVIAGAFALAGCNNDDNGSGDEGEHEHSFTHYVSDGNATCTAEGTETAKCDGCEETDTRTEKGSTLEHSYVYTPIDGETHRAKCSACDYETENNHNLYYYECDMCDYALPTSEGLDFTLIDGGKAYAVTGLGVCEDTEVVIPAKHEGLPVTQVGLYNYTNTDEVEDETWWFDFQSITAFGFTEVTKVTIPDSVTTVGVYAFVFATELEEVVFGRNVDTICIGAFFSCEKLENVNIPAGVTAINYLAFGSCTSLESVTIPRGVTSIGLCAFDSCSSLTSIEIPDSVTYVGEDAFSGCENITSTVDGVGYVDGWAVYCDMSAQIDNIVLRNNTRGIASYAFRHVSIKSITIPESVKFVCVHAFNECTGLATISVNENNPYLKSVNNCVLSKDGKSLFAGCKTSVIPDGVETVCSGAFDGCWGLEEIDIPESVKRIESRAFYQCKNLRSVFIPKNVEYIGERAFAWCGAVESVVVDENNLHFKSVNNCILTLDGKTLIYGCKDSVIPDGVESIGYGAFEGSGLASFDIPESVTVISAHAFWYSSFNNITIPVRITQLGQYSFANCNNLTDVYYEGRKDEWIAIGGLYIIGFVTSPEDITVHCSDGNLDGTGNDIENEIE